MAVQGTTTIDFGSAPGGGNYVTKTVTGQTTIVDTMYVEAWLMNVGTADHNAYEHSFIPMTVRCGNIVNGTSFDIVAYSDLRLTGTWNVYYVYN